MAVTGSFVLTLLLIAVASARLTQLIVYDTILDRPRDWITSRSGWLLDLFTCPWCAGFWVSAAWTCWFLFVGSSTPFLVVTSVFAVAQVQATLNLLTQD